MKNLLLISAIVLTYGFTNAQQWEPVGGGLNGQVHSLEIFDGMLAASGNFTLADGNPAFYVAFWDGYSWAGISDSIGFVYDLLVKDDTLFCSTDQGIWFLENQQWMQYLSFGGSYFNSIMGLYNDEIYIYFSVMMNLFKIQNHSMVHIEFLDGGVSSMVTYNDTLYFSGCFTGADTINSPHIIAYDGSQFHATGQGIWEYGFVQSLAVYDGLLYIGGDITVSHGDPGNYLITWDGQQLAPVASEPTGIVSMLTVIDNKLFMGGDFATVGSSTTGNLAMYDGNNWSGAGIFNDPWYLVSAEMNDVVYVAGNFTTVDGDSISYIAKNSGLTRAWHVPAENPTAVFAPNPFSGKSCLQIPTSRTDNCSYSLSILSPAGTCVFNAAGLTSGDNIINPGLENGIYLYRLKGSDGSTQTGKIIIQ
ncbi:MAG: T9SS type A sorting domain-containing protein [Bacteroidota bacterium]